jgi:hypothetical protein
MRTMAQKSAGARRSSATRPAQDRSALVGKTRIDSILDLQRTIGNQAVQRLIESHNGELPAGLGNPRISANPLGKRYADGDMRGEEGVDEADARAGSDVVQRVDNPPDHRLLCNASATGVSLGASGPIDEDRKYGLRTPIIVHGTELAEVLDSELVGASIDHTGSMEARPSANSNNSGFMAADNIPDDRHTSSKRDHLSYFDDHGGDGSYARLQMDLYKIPSCNITDPAPIPNSGYRIKREVKAEGDKVVGIVTKTAEEVTIGDHTSSAGLTAIKEAKVTLRE